ncbi:hypothetical protein [Rhodovulum steppense]|uniref:Uncharacterized protein n=1 Tax=Rhodovulum steppense TaxID=540251 RepID=A0A4R1YY03_9RHOB|nr:hypothetical protein [Rhodovulum steppense]TCM86131.1 hypothetical protein EV216_10596 [Rhodovulum steppense]
MTTYAPILSLKLAHTYYGVDRVPVAVMPADPAGFDRAGLLLRWRGVEAVVLADRADDRPASVTLDLVAEAPQLFAVTRGADWNEVSLLEIPAGIDDVAYVDLFRAGKISQMVSKRLARAEIALPQEGGREVTLRFDAVDALWAYVVTGGESGSGFSVFDPTGKVEFDALGPRTLPDGTAAHVLRSAVPIAARARPPERFALQRPGPFGPETVIPVLPAAGTGFRNPDEPGGAACLQSDIFVTVW